MAGTLKKVRFKVAWQAYKVGDVIEPAGTLRDWLVRQGFAEVLDTGSVEAPLTREGGKGKGVVGKLRDGAKRLFG